MGSKRGLIALTVVLILFSLVVLITAPSGREEHMVDIQPLQDSDRPQVFSFSPEARQELNRHYRTAKNEFAACLDIEQKDEYSEGMKVLHTSYEITGVSSVSYSEGENFVNHEKCVYGLIHSHEKNCFFSIADIYSIKERFRRGELFSVLICGEDEFYFITRNDFQEKKINV